MKRMISAALAGLIFGSGLIMAGMANPAKVLAFLDITGRWDPSLALVMAGAIAVALPAFAWAKRRERSLLGEAMQLPTSRRADRRLLAGSLIFGIGWGLAGICPGPALVLAGSGLADGLLFLLAMLAGMALHSRLLDS
ncbi:hypothetical protein C2134_20135 [Chromobacterium sinusclupearum]|uniref:Uncharacterized protein n=1 Tax=Chromobacterium sinusclupearum TaxID=2077146 RepID=A0A2K4MIE2_9NEIS|nr:YeeE/YedE family protein [Chromobacterium sinusclupearum]POA96856.1 hypothetical protein C2134_20135 [Chromobacterium sinusclupearum]